MAGEEAEEMQSRSNMTMKTKKHQQHTGALLRPRKLRQLMLIGQHGEQREHGVKVGQMVGTKRRGHGIAVRIGKEAAYELEQQQQAEHDAKSHKKKQEHKTPKGSKARKSTKKIAEAEEKPTKKKKTEDIEVRAGSKKAKRSENDVEVETPGIPVKKSRKAKEKREKEGKDLDHRHEDQEERHAPAEEKKSKRKKRKQPEPTAAPEPIAEAAPTEPVPETAPAEAVPETAPAEAVPETAGPGHREMEVKCKKVLAFLEGFTSLSPKDSLTLMRGRLLSFHRCRMNIYWTRGSVGLHHRKQKIDFAYFKFNSDSLPPHYLMAAAMKAAEMLAACQSCSGL